MVYKNFDYLYFQSSEIACQSPTLYTWKSCFFKLYAYSKG